MICAGSGGVGKATVSAAIAAGAAAQGKTAAVLTIDPAKRLANSLGLPELGNEERRVEMDAPGELWAMMLDAKRTFDELVDSYAPDEKTRDEVLGNPIYRQLSGRATIWPAYPPDSVDCGLSVALTVVEPWAGIDTIESLSRSAGRWLLSEPVPVTSADTCIHTRRSDALR